MGKARCCCWTTFSPSSIATSGRVLGWLEGQGQVVYTATDAQPAARGSGAGWQVAAGRLEPSDALTQGAA